MTPLSTLGMSGPASPLTSGASAAAEPGQQLFTSTGSQTWDVPAGVTEISAMCVGSRLQKRGLITLALLAYKNSLLEL